MRASPWIAAPLLLAAAPAAAQPLSERLDVRGILETDLAVQTTDGGLQKADIVLEPEATADLGAIGRLTVSGRIRFDPADELEPGSFNGQEGNRSVVSRRGFLGDAGDVELRDFYLDLSAGDVFMRLGKQQVVWGEADGLRVLDVINPLSFREFILPDFEDRRIPLWMANIEASLGPVTAQFLWIPDHTYDEIPEQGSTFAFASPLVVPQIPEGFAGAIAFAAPDRPTDIFEDDDYGVRLTGFTGGWDWSLNYLYHFQDAQVIRTRQTPDGNMVVAPAYERTHLMGATASNAFGEFTLRAEIGYSTDRFFLTDDPNNLDGVFETGELSYVLGVDYQPNGDTFLSGQVFQSVLTDAPNGAVRDDVDTTLSLLAQREFRNDTITAEVLYLQSVNNGDGQVQADLDYEWRANVILKLGADIFFGDEDGLFGQFGEADRVTVGVEIGF